MTKILLLGKHGQVGRELALALGEMKLTALGRAELDLADPDAIQRSLRALKPDIVINAAAYTDVDEAQNNSAQAMLINRDAPATIARALLARRGVLIHYSSDYVFDGRKSSPYEENDVPAPINIYGRSKLEGEQAIIGTGGSYLILRTSWVYGAGNNFCRTVWRLARQQDELKMAGDQVGSPTWAKTIASATRKLIERYGEHIRDARGIFHVAGSGAASRHALATETLRLLRLRYGDHAAKAKRITAISSDEFKTLAARPHYSALSSKKLHIKFGIATRPWQHDLAKFVSSSPDSMWT